MSLEEKIDALTDAMTALTDAIQHHAATIRGAALPGAMPTSAQIKDATSAAQGQAADPAETVATGKPRGRPKAAPPPSPAENAAKLSTQATATPGSAQGVVAGSGVAIEPELTYADLAAIVPQVAEKHGRSKAIELFAQLGVAGGKQLLAEHPEKIPVAVRLFRSAL